MASMARVRSRPRKGLADYLALPDDVAAELIDGELYVTPAPSAGHQDVLAALTVHLRPHVESRGLGRLWPAPVDVHLPAGDVVQPDLVFVRRERLAIVRDAILGVPDLAVEVLSPTRLERDR
jgi:Uma2 family endonuclease